jgi:hypothetical protein
MLLQGLIARSGRRPWTQTRLGRGLLFLGIVWSIAGAFLILQNGQILILNRAIDYGLISPDRTVNLRPGDDATLRCARPGGTEGDQQSVTDPGALHRASNDAYGLGKIYGLAAVYQSADPGKVAPILNAARNVADALGVPAPELPSIRHKASGVTEFADDLTADSQCTAARLASRFTPAHGQLYRLGVVVNYSAFWCSNGLCGALHAEILRYGQESGVPPGLWLPLVRGSLSDVPGADAREKTNRIVNDLDNYVRAYR